MSRKVITLEIDAEDEHLIRGYAEFVGEMKDLASTAPDGSVLDACEEAVIERGREHQRRLLEQAVRARLDAAEEKGRRRGGVHAARPARTAASARATSSPAWARSS